MSILIPKEDNSTKTISFSFSKTEKGDSNYFVLKNDDGSGEEIRIVFPFSFEDIPEGYSVSLYAFKHQYYSQNDLIEIRAKEKATSSGRIGYSFMLRSLIDQENNIFDKHTLPFAFYTYLKLLSGSSLIKQKIPKTKSDTYYLNEFYEEDLVLMALCDQLTQEITDFDFDDYLYFLFLYGFIYVDGCEKNMSFNPIAIIKDNFDSIKRIKHEQKYTWKINTAPKFLREEIYPGILVKKLITEQHYFLSKFHILYQVIEILIAEVLKREIELTVAESGIKKYSGHKLKDILSKLATEGFRINRLITSYSKVSDGFGSLMITKLKDFLNEIKVHLPSDNDEPVSNKLSSLVYKHRNNLVHNYRIIHKDTARLEAYLNLLVEINSYFEYLVFELLHTFNKPSS